LSPGGTPGDCGRGRPRSQLRHCAARASTSVSRTHALHERQVPVDLTACHRSCARGRFATGASRDAPASSRA